MSVIVVEEDITSLNAQSRGVEVQESQFELILAWGEIIILMHDKKKRPRFLRAFRIIPVNSQGHLT